ncbi:MAG: allophanate hydrolase [Gammaproteobacteria bacterium]|nr:allophanate hydrolase [Gammaproteobacteria bacterium]
MKTDAVKLHSLDFACLKRIYAGGALTPSALVETLIARRQGDGDPAVWINQVQDNQLRARAAELEICGPEELPLFGIPFAVKDNIDVAGMPTTAACPEFTYIAEETAPAVQRLLDAGAILIGKTNLDQFATGLTGCRSPYGSPSNPFNPDYISGGSSSGSAVAVAQGLVSFALGTDTAGSGRVPAGFNNIVGLKPAPGLVSTRGLVPACRSLDCVSVFALTCGDASRVLEVIAGFDAADPYSCAERVVTEVGGSGRFGIPRPEQLEFFGDEASAVAFTAAITAFTESGYTPVEIDYQPFREVAQLLYQGPWLAERYLSIEEFLGSRADAELVPVVSEIIQQGATISGTETFRGLHQLQALRQQLGLIWNEIDFVVTPTAPTIHTLAAVADDPIGLNDQLGYYTNHVNLLGLCAIAAPCGFFPAGLPFGITLQAPAGAESGLLKIADQIHRQTTQTLGATPWRLTDTPSLAEPEPDAFIATETLTIAVCGGHMQGLPLNSDLTSRGGRLLAVTRSAPSYRLYAFAQMQPPRPGLVRDPDGGSISLELWTLPLDQVGTFLATVPSPLCIGTIELADGSWSQGFLCESWALTGATEITAHGGWRAWLDSIGADEQRG